MPSKTHNSEQAAAEAFARELKQVRSILDRAINALQDGRSQEAADVARRAVSSLQNVISARTR